MYNLCLNYQLKYFLKDTALILLIYIFFHLIDICFILLCTFLYFLFYFIFYIFNAFLFLAFWIYYHTWLSFLFEFCFSFWIQLPFSLGTYFKCYLHENVRGITKF